MKLLGIRKFVAFILSLISFTALAVVIDDVDLLSLATGITMIGGVFFTANAVEHIKKNEKQ